MEKVRLASALSAALTAAITLRFLYPFMTHPMDHLFSDPMRHWMNGKRFFTPDLMGSIDPFLYQFWMYAVQQLTQENRGGVAAAAGLLCASAAWFWYRALREVLPKNWAKAGGIAVALMPSLLCIYGYPMNENLLVTLMAGATWLTLRAHRKRDFSSFAWAAAFWVLACYTRSIALPVAIGCLLWLWWGARLRWTYPVAAVLMFIAVGIPAAWHSHIVLKYYAPFGSGYLTQIYRASTNKVIEINAVGVGRWGFSSPVYYNALLEPFSSWKSWRDGTVRVNIDPKNGAGDWKAELERVKGEPRPYPLYYDYAENVIDTLFSTSWPDDNGAYLWGWLTIQSRWLIAPLTLLVLAGLVRVRMPLAAMLIPGVGACLMLFLMAQPLAIVEGRYRKPAEPYLVAGAFICAYYWRKRRNQDVSPQLQHA